MSDVSSCQGAPDSGVDLAQRRADALASIRQREALLNRKFPVPFPDIILAGCEPLVPYHAAARDPDDPRRLRFHAAKIAPEDVGDHPYPDGLCPVCSGQARTTFPDDGGEDGRIVRYCERCSAMGEPWETHAARQRKLHERNVASNEAEDGVVQDAITAVAESVQLSEVERRRLWNGYSKGSRLAELPLDDIVGKSRVQITRRWLTAIGQVPDWDVVLDTRGRPVGRISEGFAYDAEAA